MLTAFGFSQTWVDSIKELISSLSYFFSVLVNGSTSILFNPCCDNKQGDPLSLFLIILIIEGLGRNLQENIVSRSLKDLKH
jgi:hypothetical protein